MYLTLGFPKVRWRESARQMCIRLSITIEENSMCTHEKRPHQTRLTPAADPNQLVESTPDSVRELDLDEVVGIFDEIPQHFFIHVVEFLEV